MFVRFLIIIAVAALAVGVLVRTSSGAGKPRTYIVRPADTLWSIAEQRYGGDPRAGVWKLQRANDLDATVLRPGQRLLLP